MKIPALHTLRKKAHCSVRKGGFDPRYPTFASKINTTLEPVKIENYEQNYLQPKVSIQPQVTILIPVHNQFEHTKKCLNSITRNTSSDIPYEIILIDDLSTDETVNIENYYPEIIVIRNTKNQGFLRNMNHAATLARGKFLHLLNNDTIVSPRWLSSMLDVFNRFEKVGAVGSKLVYPNGVLQEAGGYITKDSHFGNFGKRGSCFDFRHNYIREVDYVSGASLLIKKETWDQLKGFDETFLPAYFEDTDLAMRIRQLGLCVMYQPQSVVFHLESASYEKNESSSKATQMDKNKSIFLSRWHSEMQRTHHTRHDGFRLYERNEQNRPVILYIDGEVPNYYSCGGRLSLNYCRLLKEMGYSIKFLPMVSSEAMEKDAITLGQLGIEILAGHGREGEIIRYAKKNLNLFKTWLIENQYNINHILLARPGSYDHLKIIRSIMPNASFFYHPADLHFLRNERSNKFRKQNPGFRGLRTHFRTEQKKKKELHLLTEAFKVLHVSTYEQSYLEQHQKLKNGVTIPCLFFDQINEYRKIPADLRDLMFIGGRHSASVDGVQWFLEDVFPKILNPFPKTKFHIIGDCGRDIAPTENIVVHGRLPEKQVIEFYTKTIAILPLRFGAGVKGKVLEAMHHGTPFISTTIGLEGIPDIEKATQGYDDAESFADQVIRTIKNPCEGNESVRVCQNIINSYFTKDTAVSRLKSIFN